MNAADASSLVTLKEAADALGVRPATLRWQANLRRDGFRSESSLPARLEIFKIQGGRDWLIPRAALERELVRRRGGR